MERFERDNIKTLLCDIIKYVDKDLEDFIPLALDNIRVSFGIPYIRNTMVIYFCVKHKIDCLTIGFDINSDDYIQITNIFNKHGFDYITPITYLEEENKDMYCLISGDIHKYQVIYVVQESNIALIKK